MSKPSSNRNGQSASVSGAHGASGAAGATERKREAGGRGASAARPVNGRKARPTRLARPEDDAAQGLPENGAKTPTLTLGSYLRFFWAGLAKGPQTGGIVPSQRFLIGKMVEPVPRDYRGTLVELGAGSGAITLRLAEHCPGARVLAFEINPTLAEDNRRHVAAAGLQRRVEVVLAPAQELPMELAKRRLPLADYILSGIPLGNLERRRALALIDTINQSLAKGGLYIQFQHSLLDRRKIKSRFTTLRTVPAFLNFPPAFVYYARK